METTESGPSQTHRAGTPERDLSTPALIRHAIEQSRLLVKAEILHARHELTAEIKRAKWAGILFGAAFVLLLSGISVLFVCLALALPLSEIAGTALIGGVLVLAAAALGYFGWKSAPRKPMAKTQERLTMDFRYAKEQLT